MKNEQSGWPPKGWTIAIVEMGMHKWYQALGPNSKGPLRPSYESAMQDLPKQGYAEPWGV